MKEQGCIRFADRIRAGAPLQATKFNDSKEIPYLEKCVDTLRDALQTCPVFAVDNVFGYCEEHYNGVWNVEEDLPNLVLPYPEMWLEYNMSENEFGSYACGVMMIARRRDTFREVQLDALDMRVKIETLDFDDALIRRANHLWFNEIFMCVELIKGTLTPVLTSAIWTDEHGTFISNCVPLLPAAASLAVGENRGRLKQVYSRYLFPLLFAVSLMNCRNVKMREHAPPVGLNKAFKKRNKTATDMLTFKTLAIEPMQRIIAQEGDIKNVGFKKALHTVRGHFANYSEDKPRFGRVKDGVGRFWLRPCVRGSLQEGQVVKDYAVKAPR